MLYLKVFFFFFIIEAKHSAFYSRAVLFPSGFLVASNNVFVVIIQGGEALSWYVHSHSHKCCLVLAIGRRDPWASYLVSHNEGCMRLRNLAGMSVILTSAVSLP